MNRLWIWFQSLSRFYQIGVAVLAIHVLAVALLCIDHLAHPAPKQKKGIAIRTTIAPRQPVALRETAKTPAPAAKQAPKPVVKPAPKPAAPAKGIVHKTNGPEKKGKHPEKEEGVDAGLLREIAESLGAIAATTKVSQPSLKVAIPDKIEIQQQKWSDRPGYGETVSAILQESLDLPEFGEVVAKIEIDAKGNVTRCEILDAKSRKNAEFLKKRLQELAFPCFNEFGLADNRLDFTVTFHNAETR